MIIFVLVVQIASTTFFIVKILSELLLWQITFVPWEIQELLEILSSFGLLFGVISSVILLAIASRRVRRVNTQLNAAAGDFQTHIDRQFEEWRLTPSERIVALLVIKGFSNVEIAKLRGTTESTIKSQVTSIFRKANLTSRLQLVVCVIEDVVAAIPDDAQAR
ncbi:helix-turn-helix transcriptional regulator [Yoonia sp. 67-2]|uniref:helix-turn-helix transcriptional regulator n=1 Tax=Yoonia sp. 67-2 TaxID=3081448 RepID=UPI002B40535A|nr:LuxR C-terminal-related transcriptional regulator [Yoonia sp. 67-2]